MIERTSDTESGGIKDSGRHESEELSCRRTGFFLKQQRENSGRHCLAQ